MLLVHRGDVVKAVEIGERLEVGLVLDQLLGAAMEQPDMRIDALDNFAVELKHEAQHAMGRRMLGSEIDGEFAAPAVALAALHLGLGLSHHASTSASAFAALPATDLLKRSQFTINRSWVPEPISSMSSWAANLARGP